MWNLNTAEGVCCGTLRKSLLNVHLITTLFYSIIKNIFQISVKKVKSDLFQALIIKNKSRKVCKISYSIWKYILKQQRKWETKDNKNNNINMLYSTDLKSSTMD